MSDINSDEKDTQVPPLVGVIVLVAAIIVLVGLLVLVFGSDLGVTSVSSAAATIEDTSEENTYYTQIQTGGIYDSVSVTADTTSSVFINMDRSKNIRVVTKENEGISPNELYTNPEFDPDNPPKMDDVYNEDVSPQLQLVKIEIIDPSKEAKIFVSATGASETVPIQEWKIKPQSERGNGLRYQFDVENDRLEIYPSGYFRA